MKQPIFVLELENQLIKFFDEAEYGFNSTDNIKTYDKVFISGDHKSLVSIIGIELFENDELKACCIIGAEGGKTGISDYNTLISHSGIVVCCSNTIFKLTIPYLNLEWKTISDTYTCFGIFNLNEDYVVHGELEITRLNKEGKIIWQNGGRDIWTTVEPVETFIVTDDYILATDFEYNRYKFDYDGNLIEDYKINPKKISNLKILNESKKWWKFW